MNMLLILLLLTAGEAAYYELTVEQQTSTGYQEQIEVWQKTVTQMQLDNRDLKTRKVDLENKVSQAETEAPAAGSASTPAAATPAPGGEHIDASQQQRGADRAGAVVVVRFLVLSMGGLFALAQGGGGIPT